MYRQFAPGSGVLADIREEKFCQLIAKGRLPKDARAESGLPKHRSVNKMMGWPRIKDRLDHLFQLAAMNAVMSRQGILEQVAEERRMASLGGQHAAALKALEMLGTELHGMWTKKIEVGGPGDFDKLSEIELKQYIQDKLAELGLATKLVDEEEPLAIPPPQ